MTHGLREIASMASRQASKMHEARPCRGRFRALDNCAHCLGKQVLPADRASAQRVRDVGILPDGALTARHRFLWFRMISRMGCCVEELLARDHRSAPAKLFRLLDSTDPTIVAAEDQETLEYLRSAWTKPFLDAYEHNLQSSGAVAVLTLLASPHKCDMAQIEFRRASVRRWLVSRSRTRTMDFQAWSAEWLKQQVRTRPAWRLRERVVLVRLKKDSAHTRPPKSRRRGGGGACGVFLSQALRVRKLTLKILQWPNNCTGSTRRCPARWPTLSRRWSEQPRRVGACTNRSSAFRTKVVRQAQREATKTLQIAMWCILKDAHVRQSVSWREAGLANVCDSQVGHIECLRTLRCACPF